MPEDIEEPVVLPENPTTLAELLPYLPIPAEYGKKYAMIMPPELRDRLLEVQAENPSRHVANPIQLTDGTWMLCADLLSEVPQGLYRTGFIHLDNSRFNEITIIPWDDALALIPQPEEDILP